MAPFNPCYYQSGLNRYITESDEQPLYKDSGVERQGRGAKTYTLLLGACGARTDTLLLRACGARTDTLLLRACGARTDTLLLRACGAKTYTFLFRACGAKTYTFVFRACGAEDGSQGQVRAKRARSPWIAPISHRALKVRNKQGVLDALTELSRFLHRPGATLRSPLATFFRACGARTDTLLFRACGAKTYSAPAALMRTPFCKA